MTKGCRDEAIAVETNIPEGGVSFCLTRRLPDGVWKAVSEQERVRDRDLIRLDRRGESTMKETSYPPSWTLSGNF